MSEGKFSSRVALLHCSLEQDEEGRLNAEHYVGTVPLLLAEGEPASQSVLWFATPRILSQGACIESCHLHRLISNTTAS